MQLNQNVIAAAMEEIALALPIWRRLIGISFLSADMKQRYLDLLEKRWLRITN
jgi:serine/threonine-protein kinase HipA